LGAVNTSGYEDKTLSCTLFAAGVPGAGERVCFEQTPQEVEAWKTDSLSA
jgi:hypothetical protein